ncbi:MAG: response regulator transcription factor [Verrucomicrobia bacterium]|nr:response regulator transcription factor [Verrucomicrobiota bacterium]
MKILVLEDDRKLAGLVRKGLEAQGFAVDFCSHGDDAYALATTRAYDALVLDIMVPGRDGLSILRNLRDKRLTVPVVLVTARSALPERLEGLNLGADDYLTKPFYVDELIARLHAVTRRAAGNALTLLENGHVTVNLLTREVLCAGEPVDLTAREFALLTYLLRSPGQTFTRAQICEHVWNYHFDPGTNLVDVYVQRLRRKLHDAESDSLIETIRGVGYRARPLPAGAKAQP